MTKAQAWLVVQEGLDDMLNYDELGVARFYVFDTQKSLQIIDEGTVVLDVPYDQEDDEAWMESLET